MLTHDVASSLAEIEGLAEEWAEAAGDAANPLYSSEWTLACARAMPRPPTAVHVVRRSGDLVAVAPLRAEGRGPAPRFIALWGLTGEPTGFWYRDVDALTELWRCVLAERKAVMLSSLWDDPHQWQALETAARGRTTVVRHREHQTGWAPLDGSWDDFEGAVSRNSRSWLRRKRRKLEERGAVTFEAAVPDPADVAFHVERLVRVEAAGWKGRAGTAMAHDGATRATMEHFARLSAGREACRFFHLLLDGRPVASHLYAVGAGRLWQLKIGYDEEFADSSPGILLMHEVLRHALESGFEGVEYLGNVESWQSRWPLRLHHHRTVRLYPRNPSGAWQVMLDGGVMVRKQLRSRLEGVGARTASTTASPAGR